MEKSTTTVTIEKSNGSITPDTRSELADAFKGLSDGWHKVTIQEVRRGYTSTRYKYYFAHVMETILLSAGHHFKVMEGDTVRGARTTEEIHSVMKLRYNATTIKTPFGLYITPETSTSLTDREFITQFEETIIAEFSSPPYGCDFMGREEWAAMMKSRK